MTVIISSICFNHLKLALQIEPNYPTEGKKSCPILEIANDTFNPWHAINCDAGQTNIRCSRARLDGFSTTQTPNTITIRYNSLWHSKQLPRRCRYGNLAISQWQRGQSYDQPIGEMDSRAIFRPTTVQWSKAGQKFKYMKFANSFIDIFHDFFSIE